MEAGEAVDDGYVLGRKRKRRRKLIYYCSVIITIEKGWFGFAGNAST